ncbi:MAG: hypothetical protein Q8O36_01455 [Candidatus Omnitrophota bacterium]|nr:hypothetical protein [Candidatus Omnitrophota bacterium]MDP3787046.1 hypothetical protein [Candidatus Omnitrophota bacterium]
MSGWKDAERQVARILDGRRRVRINYSESCEDVYHHIYSIEVKYGKQVPKWIGKICRRGRPVILNSVLVLFPLASGSFNSAIEVKRVKIKFLVDGMVQAHSYNTRKTPMLCMKPRGYRGIIGCLYLLDYLDSRFCR